MQQLQLITTQDGSHSLYVPGLDETYHSTYGAIQEAQHVFIQHGLSYWIEKQRQPRLKILEVGLGTGLNALLTFLTSSKEKVLIEYTGLEPFPIPWTYVQRLNYAAKLAQVGSYNTAYKDLQVKFAMLHQSKATSFSKLSDYFLFQKLGLCLEDFSAPSNSFDLIYFDAFAPSKQPEMWTIALLQKITQTMKIPGVLVTYCAQGQLKRNLQQLGMHLETLPGPPGKKEMIRTLR